MPWAGSFLETNVRLYSIDATGRRGIVFLSLDTDRLLKLPGLEKLTREQRMAFASVNHLSLYSNRNTLELLDGTGISCPPIESYLDKLIDYAQKARQKET